ncbi:hypothetical protein PCA31118_03196 [Pandoraea captiosa]|uniref:Uncharacterized protein n=2 Tax=Pandoraea captiosa TaxID=2508302 RepID=A0A5E5AA39_9BURK|nr:hypothetical protein PCA31118_03196 [Pandoraea captiosa]
MRVVDGVSKDYFSDEKEASLARAAAEGNLGKVRQLVREGVNVNAVGDKNMSPLGWAFSAKNVEGLRALLEAGADPNQPIGPEHEIHLVWLAAEFESPEILKVLLEFKGDPNATHKGLMFNALRQSIMRPANMKLLVEAGADVNAADSSGFGVAHIAANLRQYEVVDYLLEHGYRRDLPRLAWAVNDGKVSADGLIPRQKTLAILRSMGFEPKPGRPPAFEGISVLPNAR